MVSAERIAAADDQLLRSYELVVTVGLPRHGNVIAREALATDAAQTLCLLIPRQAFERLAPPRGDGRPRRLSAVFIDQPLSRQLELLRIALPGRNRVGVVLGPYFRGTCATSCAKRAPRARPCLNTAEVAESVRVSTARCNACCRRATCYSRCPTPSHSMRRRSME